MKRTALLTAALSVAIATPAIAHPGHEFSSGFYHPFTGVDHLAAMLAIGACGALIGGRAVWALPLGIMAAMLVGAWLAVAGVTLPLAAVVIAISVPALAALAMPRFRVFAWPALMLAAWYAVSQGYLHAADMPAGSGAVAYGLSFLASTAILQLFGITAGLFVRRRLAGT